MLNSLPIREVLDTPLDDTLSSVRYKTWVSDAGSDAPDKCNDNEPKAKEFFYLDLFILITYISSGNS